MALLLFGAQVLMAGATHIVGGEMNYTYLGNNRYRVRLDLYIDCINGEAGAIASDATAYFGVWDGNTRRMIFGYPTEVSRSGPQRVQKTNYNCISVAPNACVDRYWYETTLTLAPRTGGYIISFQRCCRNNTISNLSDPGGNGANYWTTIPDPRTLPDKKENSSAVFKELPPNFLCTNTPLKFDHSAADADGDSLAYDLFWPYTGGTRQQPRPNNGTGGSLENPPFSLITWAGSYNHLNPIDGNPALSIDEKTGFLTLTPTRVGQYVVGIRVREYRRGQLISETKRDYQFNVQACVIDVVASYFSPSIICGFNYQFRNTSSGGQRFHWDFGVAGTRADTSNQTQPTFTFPGPGLYTVRLYAWKNRCVDSFKQTIEVLSPQKPKLPADTTLCEGQSLNLTCNLNGDSYRWNTGATSKSITVNTDGQYWVELSVKTCKWRDTINVAIDRDKVDVKGDTLYCSDETFSRRLTATTGMKTYNWSSGETTSAITVTNSGVYRLTAMTVNGCVSSDSAVIRRYSPIKVSLRDTTVCSGQPVRYDNQNPGADRTIWSTGESTASVLLRNPGVYIVKVTKGLCSTLDTFSLSNFPMTLELGPNLKFCEVIDTVITAPRNDFLSVTWNSDVTGNNYRLTRPGKLTIDVVNRFGCPETDSLVAFLFANPVINLGADTVVCLSVNPRLDAGPGMQEYWWSNKDRNQVTFATEPGQYWVRVKDVTGCLGSDTVTINKRGDLVPSVVFMPNAFTPDGNGINDFYPQNKYINIGSLYLVKIYNRWGEKLAELASPDFNWDGTINGNPAPEGVYVFLATWIGCDNQRRTLRGDFHLLR